MTANIVHHHFGCGRVVRIRPAMLAIPGNHLKITRVGSKPTRTGRTRRQKNIGLKKGAVDATLTLQNNLIWGMSDKKYHQPTFGSGHLLRNPDPADWARG